MYMYIYIYVCVCVYKSIAVLTLRTTSSPCRWGAPGQLRTPGHSCRTGQCGPAPSLRRWHAAALVQAAAHTGPL